MAATHQSTTLSAEPIELLDDAVIERQSSSVIDAWSLGAELLYGYSAEDVIGAPYEVLVPDGRRAADCRIAREVLRDGLTGRYESLRICKDGTVIGVWVRISPIRDATDSIVGVSTIEHSRLVGGDAAPDVEGYLRSAFEDAPIGIALISLDSDRCGHFVLVNRALSRLTGYSPSELMATEVTTIIHPDDVEPDRVAMARLLSGESDGFQLEQRLIHSGRHVVWVMVSASLIRDESGRPTYCIRQVQDIEERKRFEGELGYLVDHDPPTGLLNRRGFVRELTHEIAEVRRYGGGGAVLFIDIDDFKHVNDTLGHSVGDALLSDVARVVRERLRETDVLARLGGDEFAILLPHAVKADAEAVSRSVLAAIKTADLGTLGGGARVGASVGIATFEDPGAELTADDVLIDADLAMYAAKAAGKDRFVVASADNLQQMKSRVTWAGRVQAALRRNQFELHGQPILDLRAGTISQWELLLRLPGDHGELILPEQFLYTAERSGSILAIDRWVLHEAIELIARHRDAGRELRLHVNLSGRSVGEQELPEFIERELETLEVDPSRLVLEVTETAAIANMDRARRFAARLTAAGCQFALDDFGAGFGSFYYLKYIPFDYVKIDGEFIRQLPASSTDQLILDSIVQMSKGLGKRTIAEFAGDAETVEVLLAHGVDYAQGYHLGRPAPVADVLAL